MRHQRGIAPHPRRKRNTTERARDRALVGQLALRGMTLTEIRDHLNARNRYQLSLGQIHYDAIATRHEWLEKMGADRNELLAAELEKLDRLETVAWEVYWQSVKIHPNSPQSRFQIIPKEDVQEYRVVPVSESYRLLNVIGGVIAQRTKLLGLAAPSKSINATVNLDRMRTVALEMARERGIDESEVDDIVQDASTILARFRSD
jgi:hypothetical protein